MTLEPSRIKSLAPFKKSVCAVVAFTFLFTSLISPDMAHAQRADMPIATTEVANKLSQLHYDINSIYIPQETGLIKESFQGANGKAIIHIQDAHVNYEGQKNLAAILERLIKESGIELVLVEGGEGDVGISYLRYFSTRDHRERVADTFLKKGKIAGEEYLDIVSEPELQFDIYGIEDKALYQSNLDQFLKIDAFRDEASAYLDDLEKALRLLKEDIYTEDLKAFEGMRYGYSRGEADMLSYCGYLASEIASSAYTQTRPPRNDGLEEIAKVLELKRIEDSIDFDIVNTERDAFIEELSKKLPERGVEILLEKSIAFKSGTITAARFYSILRELGATAGLDQSLYTNLNIYSLYITLHATLDNDALFSQIEEAEGLLKKSIPSNEQQRELIDVTERLELVGKFIDLALTPDEYKEYTSDKNGYRTEVISRIVNKLAKRTGIKGSRVHHNSVIDKNLGNLEKFYTIAGERDGALFKNAIDIMNEKNQERAVLIAGGFHTESLMPLFRDEDYSYVVVTPKTTHETDLELYRSLLRGDDYNTSHLRLAPVVQRAPAFRELVSKIVTDSISGSHVIPVEPLDGPGEYRNLDMLVSDGTLAIMAKTMPRRVRDDVNDGRVAFRLEGDTIVADKVEETGPVFKFSLRTKKWEIDASRMAAEYAAATSSTNDTPADRIDAIAVKVPGLVAIREELIQSYGEDRAADIVEAFDREISDDALRRKLGTAEARLFQLALDFDRILVMDASNNIWYAFVIEQNSGRWENISKVPIGRKHLEGVLLDQDIACLVTHFESTGPTDSRTVDLALTGPARVYRREDYRDDDRRESLPGDGPVRQVRGGFFVIRSDKDDVIYIRLGRVGGAEHGGVELHIFAPRAISISRRGKDEMQRAFHGVQMGTIEAQPETGEAASLLKTGVRIIDKVGERLATMLEPRRAAAVFAKFVDTMPRELRLGIERREDRLLVEHDRVVTTDNEGNFHREFVIEGQGGFWRTINRVGSSRVETEAIVLSRRKGKQVITLQAYKHTDKGSISFMANGASLYTLEDYLDGKLREARSGNVHVKQAAGKIVVIRAGNDVIRIRLRDSQHGENISMDVFITRDWNLVPGRGILKPRVDIPGDTSSIRCAGGEGITIDGGIELTYVERRANSMVSAVNIPKDAGVKYGDVYHGTPGLHFIVTRPDTPFSIYLGRDQIIDIYTEFINESRDVYYTLSSSRELPRPEKNVYHGIAPGNLVLHRNHGEEIVIAGDIRVRLLDAFTDAALIRFTDTQGASDRLYGNNQPIALPSGEMRILTRDPKTDRPFAGKADFVINAPREIEILRSELQEKGAATSTASVSVSKASFILKIVIEGAGDVEPIMWNTWRDVRTGGNIKELADRLNNALQGSGVTFAPSEAEPETSLNIIYYTSADAREPETASLWVRTYDPNIIKRTINTALERAVVRSADTQREDPATTSTASASQEVKMPITMIDPDKGDARKGTQGARRRSAIVSARGSLKIGRSFKHAEITPISANAEDYAHNELNVAKALCAHAVTSVLGTLQNSNRKRNIVNDIFGRLKGLDRASVPIEFLRDNGTLCDSRAISGGAGAQATPGIGIDLDIYRLAEEFGIKVRSGRVSASFRSKDNLEGVSIVLAMSIMYELAMAAGREDAREAMKATLELFELLNNKQRRLAIDILRRSNTIDSGNAFAFFLEIATNKEIPFNYLGIKQTAGKHREKRIEAWQNLWVNWILWRNDIDEPFDGEAMRKAMLESKNPTELRARLHDVMLTSYDRELDEDNIRRMHKEALEEGQKLFYVLFSRAFWYPSALIANSTNVDPSGLKVLADRLRGINEDRADIDKLIAAGMGDFDEDELIGSAGEPGRVEKLFQYLSSGITRIEEAVGSDKITRAKLEGSYYIFQKQFEEYFQKEARQLILDIREANKPRITREKREAAALKVFGEHSRELKPIVDRLRSRAAGMSSREARVLAVQQSRYRGQIDSHFYDVASKTEKHIDSLERALEAKEKAFNSTLTAMRQGAQIAPQTDAAKILLGRRISKAVGAYETAMILHMIDPFVRDWTGGEEPVIADLIEGGARNMYVTQSSLAHEYASDILIPLPLFIFNNEIDYKDLEGTLRNWFGSIYRNIYRAQDSEFMALAREIAVERSKYGKDLRAAKAGEGREELARDIVKANRFLQVRSAQIASLIKKSVTDSPEVSLALAKYIGEKQATGDDAEHYDALCTVLREDSSEGNLLYEALTRADNGERLDTVLKEMVLQHDLQEGVAAFGETVTTKREPTRNIMIGTTQSLGMSEYLLGYWMLEELFMNKVSDDYHLSGEIRGKKGEYDKLLASSVYKLVEESPVLEQEMGDAAYSDDQAEYDKGLLGLIDKFDDVSEQSAALLILTELAAGEGGHVKKHISKHEKALRKAARKNVIARHRSRIDAYKAKRGCTEKTAIKNIIDNDEHRAIEIENEILSLAKIEVLPDLMERIDKIKFRKGSIGSIESYIEANRAPLTAKAKAELADKYKERVEARVIELGGSRERALIDLLGGREEYEGAIERILLREARQEILRQLLIAREIISAKDKALEDYLEKFIYDRRRIGITTATKEVIGRHGLSSLVLDPRYMSSYKGLFKAFNYAYTPSLVDLGKGTEIESVRNWWQWVGGTDLISAEAVEETMGLFNYNPVSFLRPLGPEAGKPNQNSSLLAAAIKGTIDGLAYNAAGWGDAEVFMDFTNMRTPPSPTVSSKPAQETSAGFCLPKDWEFIRKCLSLTTNDALEYYGFRSEKEKREIKRFVKEEILEDLSGCKTVEEKIAGLARARRKLADNDIIKKYFTVTDDFIFLPNFVVIAESMENFGVPEEEGPKKDKKRMARSQSDMVTQQYEKSNRTHAVSKAFYIREVARKARDRNPNAKHFSEVKIVRGSEYKAPRGMAAVRDPRNAASVYIAEIFARTCGYRFEMFRDEERREVESWLWGKGVKYIDELEGLLKDPERRHGMLRPFDYIRRLAKKKDIKTVEGVLEALKKSRSPKAFIVKRTLEAALLKRLYELLPQELKTRVEDQLGAQRRRKPANIDELISRLDTETALDVEEIWYGVRPPEDIRFVTTTGQTAEDLIGYHVDAEIGKHIDYVRDRLLEAGITEPQIRANAVRFGGKLSAWYGIKDLPKERFELLERSIRGKIIFLVLFYRGLDPSYEMAAQGADIIDTGIAPKELMDLLKDPWHLRDLMLFNNPNSSLAIVDGSSQGRMRAMTRQMVKNWFSASDRAVYNAMGVGDEEIDDPVHGLRAEMERERRQARKIFELLKAGEFAEAQEYYTELCESKGMKRRVKTLLEDEDRAKRIGTFDNHNTIQEAVSRVHRGLALDNMDFGTWLALGGMYIVNGNTKEDIESYEYKFNEAVAAYQAWLGTRSEEGPKSYSTERIEKIKSVLVVAKRPIEMAEFQVESAETGSLKQAEAKKVSASEVLLAKSFEKERHVARSRRRKVYERESTRTYGRNYTFRDNYDKAIGLIGDGTRPVTDDNFGAFLAYAHRGLLSLAHSILDVDDPDRERIIGDINSLFKKREISIDDWQRVAGSYVQKGALAELAEKLKGSVASRKERLREELARGCELVYIALALELTVLHSQKSPDKTDEASLWKALATLTSEIFYDHVWDYPPIFGQAMRGVGFTDFDYIKGEHTARGRKQKGRPLTREEILEIGVERYSWIYGYMRHLITTRTDFKNMTEEERAFHLGDPERGVYPAGSRGQTELETRWVTMTHLREIAFYRNEGLSTAYGLTIDPSAIKADERVSEVYVAPFTRQHMFAGVEEGPTLQKIAPVNVMITRGLRKVENFRGSGNAAYVLDDAYMFLSKEDFVVSYMQSHPGVKRSQAEAIADRELKKNPKGIFCAIKFTSPVPMDVPLPLHGHPLFVNGDLEEAGYPHTINGARIFSDAAYSKDVGPLAHDPKKGGWVLMPPEIDWQKEWTFQEGKKAGGKRVTAKDIKGWIRNGKPGTTYVGLEEFFKRHPKVKEIEVEVVPKAARQSGGRQATTFSSNDIDKAVDWIYEQSKSDSFAIQLYIHVPPSVVLTPEATQKQQDRLIQKGLAVSLDRRPNTFLTLFARAKAVSSDPGQDHKIYHHLFGVSVDKIGNVGRGGTVEEMLSQYVDSKLRNVIYDRIEEHVRLSLKEFRAFLEGDYMDTYVSERGSRPGRTITGNPYTWIPYVMCDFIIRPIFRRLDTGDPIKDGEAELVDVETLFDSTGKKPIGVKIIMQNSKGEQFEVEPFDVDIFEIEKNAGTGLTYHFKQTELMREIDRIAQERGISRQEVERSDLDVESYGRQLRIMLYEFAKMGRADRKERLGQSIEFPSDADDKASELHQKLPEEARWTTDLTQELLERAMSSVPDYVKPRGGKFGKDQLSVILKHFILGAIEREFGSADEIRQKIKEDPAIIDAMIRRASQLLYNHKDVYTAIRGHDD
ncbi:MAG: hypothetical protein ABH875_02890, partial [Candidatus Omnitrophota bacterium]